MFRPALMRRRRAGVALAIGIACAVAPGAALSAPIDLLGRAGTFVVLGGNTVTNAGTTVLYGDLGTYPGTGISGFGFPSVVSGTTHGGDAFAADAQIDLTAAYDTGQGLPSQFNLTGQNLGGMSLGPAVYSFATSAQQTGNLTLNGQGNSDALFVFQIGTTLTTASNSTVFLVNGASACNVYWMVGSSATLGTNSVFAGNILALLSITMNNGASLPVGRLLAQNGSVTLDSNTVLSQACATPTPTPTPTPTTTSTTTDDSGAAAALAARTAADTAARAAAQAALTAQANQTSSRHPTTTRNGTTTMRRTSHATCTSGFRASVRGTLIKNVVFRLDGNRVSSLRASRLHVFVRALPGAHKVTARVTFTDATRAKTLALGYRACADAALTPKAGPSAFTG